MATNFPTSLDTFTNPNSGNTLDSPSHSIQHSDINDAVEAIEAKIGVGSSTAGSATAGYALVNTSGGTTAYSLLGVSGLSSGTAVANTFLRANGSGAATFAPTAQGLTLLIPSSVAVGSGTGTVSATGTVDFSGASSVSINDVFNATYNSYKIVFDALGSSGSYSLNMRLRIAGADNSTANYNFQYLAGAGASPGSGRVSGQTAFVLDGAATTDIDSFMIDLQFPFETKNTNLMALASLHYNTPSTITTYVTNCSFTQNTSFTGFTIIASTGNITGNVSVYGFNK